MIHRRTSMLKVSLVIGVLLAFAYGYYMFSQISEELVLAQETEARCVALTSNLKGQLKMIYTHVNKLQTALKNEREAHKTDKTSHRKDIKICNYNLTRSKSRYDEMKIQYESVQVKFSRLATDNKRMSKENEANYSVLKKDKDNESKALQERVQHLFHYNQRLQSRNSELIQQLSKMKGILSKANTQIMSFHKSGKAYEGKLTELRGLLQQSSYNTTLCQHKMFASLKRLDALEAQAQEKYAKDKRIPTRIPTHTILPKAVILGDSEFKTKEQSKISDTVKYIVGDKGSDTGIKKNERDISDSTKIVVKREQPSPDQELINSISAKHMPPGFIDNKELKEGSDEEENKPEKVVSLVAKASDTKADSKIHVQLPTTSPQKDMKDISQDETDMNILVDDTVKLKDEQVVMEQPAGLPAQKEDANLVKADAEGKQLLPPGATTKKDSPVAAMPLAPQMPMNQIKAPVLKDQNIAGDGKADLSDSKNLPIPRPAMKDAVIPVVNPQSIANVKTNLKDDQDVVMKNQDKQVLPQQSIDHPAQKEYVNLVKAGAEGKQLLPPAAAQPLAPQMPRNQIKAPILKDQNIVVPGKADLVERKNMPIPKPAMKDAIVPVVNPPAKVDVINLEPVDANAKVLHREKENVPKKDKFLDAIPAAIGKLLPNFDDEQKDVDQENVKIVDTLDDGEVSREIGGDTVEDGEIILENKDDDQNKEEDDITEDDVKNEPEEVDLEPAEETKTYDDKETTLDEDEHGDQNLDVDTKKNEANEEEVDEDTQVREHL